jgi:hypothetical protein
MVSKELIISRFNEDVSWVKDTTIPTTVYNKGPKIHIDHPLVEVIDLKNVGRESHTFAYHYYHNYTDLADMVFLVQGKPHTSIEELWNRISINYEDTTPLSCTYLPNFPSKAIKALDRVETIWGFEVRWGRAEYHGNRQPSDIVGWIEASWHQWFDCQRPDPQWFGYGHEYAIPKNRITDRPKEFWGWMVHLMDWRDTGMELTPTSAWAIESLAYYLYSDARIYPTKSIKVPKVETVSKVSKPCNCGKDRPRVLNS